MITEIINIFIRDFKRPLSAFHVVDRNTKDACVLALLVMNSVLEFRGPFLEGPETFVSVWSFQQQLVSLILSPGWKQEL